MLPPLEIELKGIYNSLKHWGKKTVKEKKDPNFYVFLDYQCLQKILNETKILAVVTSRY